MTGAVLYGPRDVRFGHLLGSGPNNQLPRENHGLSRRRTTCYPDRCVRETAVSLLYVFNTFLAPTVLILLETPD